MARDLAMDVSGAPVSRPIIGEAHSYSDVLSAPASSVHSNLLQQTSIEGGENSPPVSLGANDPGLNSAATAKGFTMSSTWKWIIGIVLALLALWYFFGKSSTVAA